MPTVADIEKIEQKKPSVMLKEDLLLILILEIASPPFTFTFPVE